MAICLSHLILLSSKARKTCKLRVSDWFLARYTRYHVYLARNQSETPSLQVFLPLLESKIKCERQMAIKNSNYKKYRAKWTTLCICDACASYFYVFKQNQAYSVSLNIQ